MHFQAKTGEIWITASVKGADDAAAATAGAQFESKLQKPSDENASTTKNGFTLFQFNGPQSIRSLTTDLVCAESLIPAAQNELAQNELVNALSKFQAQIVQVAFGARHAIALDAAGSVFAVGSNEDSQLGISSTRVGTVSEPTKISKFDELGAQIVQVAAGSAFSVALDSVGHCYTWGRGDHGELGTGQTVHPTPRFVAKLQHNTIVKVVCGSQFAAALDNQRKVHYFGTGLAKREPLPVQIPFSDTIVDIAAGFSHLAAVSARKQLFTLGLGLFGQLGHGRDRSAIQARLPRLVDTLRDKAIARVFCGDFFTAAVTESGEVYTFGSGKNGKLGHGGDADEFTPRLVEALRGFPVAEVACSSERMACFIPTRLNQASASCLPCTGNTRLRLSGVGTYETNANYHVRFVAADVQAVVDGVYDAATNSITCQTPRLIPSNAANSLLPAHPRSVDVSVSLDGSFFSNALTLPLFANPAPISVSVEPAFGPLSGGTRVSIKAKFESAPYRNVLVAFHRETAASHGGARFAEQLTVPATFDAVAGCLRCVTPAFNDAKAAADASTSTLCRTTVLVALDGQQFSPLNAFFSFYDVQASAVEPSALPLDGGLIRLRAHGVHFASRVSVQFRHANRELPVLTAPATFERTPDAKRDPEQLASGTIVCRAPDFSAHGAGAVQLAVTLNEVDFTRLAPTLDVRAPVARSIVPDCGPLFGGTEVHIHGEFLFDAPRTSVKLRGASGDLVVAARFNAATSTVVFTTPTTTAAGPTKLSIAFDTSRNAYTDTDIVFHFYESPVVTDATPATCPVAGGSPIELGGRGFLPSPNIKVRLTLLEDESAKPTSKSSLSSRPARKSQQPTAAAASPSSVTETKGGSRPGSASSTSNSRPTTPRDPKDSSAAAAGGDAAASAKKEDAKSKQAAKPSARKGAAAAAETKTAAPPPVEAAPKVQPIVLTLPATFNANLLSEEELAKRAKRKAPAKPKTDGKGKPVAEPELATLSFVCPNVAQFGLDFGPDGVLGSLRQFSIDLALNGQQFVETGKVITFEKVKPAAPTKGGKAAAAAATGADKKPAAATATASS